MLVPVIAGRRLLFLCKTIGGLLTPPTSTCINQLHEALDTGNMCVQGSRCMRLYICVCYYEEWYITIFCDCVANVVPIDRRPALASSKDPEICEEPRPICNRIDRCPCRRGAAGRPAMNERPEHPPQPLRRRNPRRDTAPGPHACIHARAYAKRTSSFFSESTTR